MDDGNNGIECQTDDNSGGSENCECFHKLLVGCTPYEKFADNTSIYDHSSGCNKCIEVSPAGCASGKPVVNEIDKVLDKYSIDAKVPIIAQIGRFDPWKGIDRTIATYREVRKEKHCQLIVAGGSATDDPEGARIIAQVEIIFCKTKHKFRFIHYRLLLIVHPWTLRE